MRNFLIIGALFFILFANVSHAQTATKVWEKVDIFDKADYPKSGNKDFIVPRKISALPDGSFLLGGNGYGLGTYNFYFSKISSTGVEQWQSPHYNDNRYQRIFDIAQGSNGDIFATCEGNEIGSGLYTMLFWMDSSGNKLWKKNLGLGTSNARIIKALDEKSLLTVSANKNPFYGLTTFRTETFKIKSKKGNPRAKIRHKETKFISNLRLFNAEIIQANDNTVYVAGFFRKDKDSPVIAKIIKADLTGNVIWEQEVSPKDYPSKYSSFKNDHMVDIAVNNHGDVVFGIRKSNDAFRKDQALMVLLDSSGAKKFEKITPMGNWMVLTDSGNIFSARGNSMTLLNGQGDVTWSYKFPHKKINVTDGALTGENELLIVGFDESEKDFKRFFHKYTIQ